MTADVTISVWLFVVLIAVAVIAVLDRVLIPSSRWFLRRRINRVIEEIGTRLDIGIRPFQLTKRQVLVDRLIYDPTVIEAVRSYAREHDIPLEVVQNKVVVYAREIVPSFNAYFYFRIGYWIAKKVARMLFRFMGAFFVRRNSGNPLYRRVLERYIHMATQEGVCQAIFLEGGLSRDGRLGDPKLGLMDYMLRQFDPQRDRDIVFIPVGINYDRTIEDRSLLRRLTPDTRRRSLWYVFRTTTGFILRNLVLMVLSRWRRYGYACVNFGTPLSIKTYCRETGMVFSQLERKDRFPKIETLCRRLMGEIADVIPVLPVSLVSAVFLEAPATDLGILEVEQRANELIEILQKNKAPVLETPRSTRMAAIADAIDRMQLRGMIDHTDGRYMVVAHETPILRYYANAIAHWLPGHPWR